MIISVDNFNFSESLELLPWYVLNNIDPSHDCIIENNILVIDASIKTKSKDGFTRQWPNIVCMDSATIEVVDKKWSTLVDLELIPSPSKKLLQLQKGNSAVCDISDYRELEL
jgi:hypothetical protein